MTARPTPSSARIPKFLSEVAGARTVAPASFGGTGETPIPAPAPMAAMPRPTPDEPHASRTEPLPPSPMPSHVEARPPPPVAPPPEGALHIPTPPPQVDPTRLLAAIEKLKLQSERLAEQARSDALEIGFQVARRILELELTTSPQPLFALVRSAIQRVGDARKVTIRLCPNDMARIENNGGKTALGLAIAHLEIVPDTSLTPGDCLIDSDVGSVDGRLNTRLDELHRAVAQAVAGDAA